MRSSIFTLGWVGISVWLLGGSGLEAAAVGPSGQNPYAAIAVRNLFHLSAAPQGPPRVLQEQPGVSVRLMGVTDILRDRVALLKLELPARPPERPHEKFVILAEGQRDGELEVVRVDVRAGVVNLVNAGKATTVSLELAGAKPAVGHPPLPEMGPSKPGGEGEGDRRH